jgi:hypothetical protein
MSEPGPPRQLPHQLAELLAEPPLTEPVQLHL